jgi:mono/diheme cytochrome c family protein
MKMRLILAAALVALTACAAPIGGVDEAPADIIADGKMIATGQCAACHATGSQGLSPRPEAAPLRVILSDYDSNALAEEFIEGIKVGHPDMPQFNFSPRETQSLVAYLQSIQEKPAQERAGGVN